MPGPGVQLFSAWSLSGAYRTVITQRRRTCDTLMLDGLVNAPGVGPVLLVSLALLTAVRLRAAALRPHPVRAASLASRPRPRGCWRGHASPLSSHSSSSPTNGTVSSQFPLSGGFLLAPTAGPGSIGSAVGPSSARARVAAWTLGLVVCCDHPGRVALDFSPPEGEARVAFGPGHLQRAGPAGGLLSSSSPWPCWSAAGPCGVAIDACTPPPPRALDHRAPMVPGVLQLVFTSAPESRWGQDQGPARRGPRRSVDQRRRRPTE